MWKCPSFAFHPVSAVGLRYARMSARREAPQLFRLLFIFRGYATSSFADYLGDDAALSLRAGGGSAPLVLSFLYFDAELLSPVNGRLLTWRSPIASLFAGRLGAFK